MKKLTRANLIAFERLRKNTTFNALSYGFTKYPNRPATVKSGLSPDVTWTHGAFTEKCRKFACKV